ncbi:hypothetical protein LAZ67_14002056 [Cordylochernes scorpioides]|uniref:CCHC-type domain-containing protein n=1 Tax=Cordylochernes scorpioides TaxID=51811 RepID=A0ABY6LBH4_9ARAC|nr:hypothetical protein LAZ67_14002056 [Cordylochernes scorpioides]
MTQEEQLKMSDAGVCFKCLKRNHLRRHCRTKIICQNCGGPHYLIFCRGNNSRRDSFSENGGSSKERKNNSSVQNQKSTVLLTQSCASEILLMTVRAKVCSSETSKIINVLLDSGSQYSFIKESLAEELGLEKLGERKLTKCLFGGRQTREEKHSLYSISITNILKEETVQVKVMGQRMICDRVPILTAGTWMRDLDKKGVTIIRKKNVETSEIDLLLGANNLSKIWTDQVVCLEDGLTSINTKIGWSIFGEISLKEGLASEYASPVFLTMSHKIMDLWDSEMLGVRDPVENISQGEKAQVEKKSVVEESEKAQVEKKSVVEESEKLKLRKGLFLKKVKKLKLRKSLLLKKVKKIKLRKSLLLKKVKRLKLRKGLLLKLRKVKNLKETPIYIEKENSIDNDALCQALKANSITSTQRLSGELGKSQTTVVGHFHKQGTATCTSRTSWRRILFPKRKLPEFGGDVQEWITFCSRFEEILNDEYLTNSDKYQYLVDCMLENYEAKQLVLSYPVSGKNYASVIKDLKERFWLDNMLIKVYVRDLMWLVIRSAQEKKVNLKDLVTKLNSQIRHLSMLGVTTDKGPNILYPCSSKSEDLESLMKFIHRGVNQTKDREMAYNKHSDALAQPTPGKIDTKKRSFNERREIATTSGFMHSNISPTMREKFKCIFCDNGHPSQDFRKGMKMSMDQKNEEIKIYKRCFKCLLPGHRSGDRWNTWIEPAQKLKENKSHAEKRLRKMTEDLKKRGFYHHHNKIFEEWEENGIIERIQSDQDDELEYFLPHRAVVKSGSSPTPVRPVFDASLAKEERQFLRFLWWEDGKQENLRIYQHKRVVFGVTSSPFLLAATLKLHLEQYEREVIPLLKCMYMDNCVNSVTSLEEAQVFQQQSIDRLSPAGFNLRKWQMEGPSIVNGENISVHTERDTADDTLTISDKLMMTPAYKSLDRENDDEIENQTHKLTKRIMLSETHAVFDPLGLFSPFTIVPKIILQQCWESELKWDQPVPKDIAKKFVEWQSQIPELLSVRIPRWVMRGGFEQASLHVFCDASQDAYATCIYLRSVKNKEVNVQLVTSKARIYPKKKLTISRLELMSCLIGSRLTKQVMKFISESIEITEPNIRFWTNSSTALHWIQNEKSLSETESTKSVLFRRKKIGNMLNIAINSTKDNIMDKLEKYGVYHCIIRIVAYLLHFKRKTISDQSKPGQHDKISKQISVEEFEEAEKTESIPIPATRIGSTPAFGVIGVDLAGPLTETGGKKIWVVLYTCAVYRAVHLEITKTVSSEGILDTFRRFVARRGRQSIVYFDNGLNFFRCNNLFKKVNWNDALRYATVQLLSGISTPQQQHFGEDAAPNMEYKRCLSFFPGLGALTGIQGLNKMVESLQMEHQSQVEMNSVLQKHNESLRVKQDVLTQQIADLEALKLEQEKALRDRDLKIKDLQKHLSQTKEELKQQQAEGKKLHSSLKSGKESLQAADQKISSLEQELRALELVCSQREATITEMTAQNRLLNEEVTKAKEITTMIHNLTGRS